MITIVKDLVIYLVVVKSYGSEEVTKSKVCQSLPKAYQNKSSDINKELVAKSYIEYSTKFRFHITEKGVEFLKETVKSVESSLKVFKTKRIKSTIEELLASEDMYVENLSRLVETVYRESNVIETIYKSLVCLTTNLHAMEEAYKTKPNASPIYVHRIKGAIANMCGEITGLRNAFKEELLYLKEVMAQIKSLSPSITIDIPPFLNKVAKEYKWTCQKYEVAIYKTCDVTTKNSMTIDGQYEEKGESTIVVPTQEKGESTILLPTLEKGELPKVITKREVYESFKAITKPFTTFKAITRREVFESLKARTKPKPTKHTQTILETLEQDNNMYHKKRERELIEHIALYNSLTFM